MKLKLTKQQIPKIKEWFHTSRYVYNKAVHAIETGSSVDEFKLRDKLVTCKTKKTHPKYQEITDEINKIKQEKKEKKTKEEKDKYQKQIEDKKVELRNVAKELPSEKNDTLFEWELNTHKDIRTGSIKDVCTSYKGCFTRLKNGQITHFKMKFRKKTNPRQCMLLPTSIVKKNKKGEFIFSALKMHAKIKVGKRNWKELKTMEIENDCRIMYDKNEYFIMIPIKKEITEPRKAETYCGIDMGVRTFSTIYGSHGVTELDYNEKTLDKLNNKLDAIRNKRSRPLKEKQRLRSRRKHINKLERRKENLIDELHWKSIGMILNNHNLVFYGDIKSHDIVKTGENKWLNRRFQDLKLFKYKQRFKEKCQERNALFIEVKEHYTTKTCSVCGTINEPGKSKVYQCKTCKKEVGRDINAAKNMLMKGLLCSI
jgi:transposase